MTLDTLERVLGDPRNFLAVITWKYYFWPIKNTVIIFRIKNNNNKKNKLHTFFVGFLPVEQRHDAEDIAQSTHHSRQQSQDPRDKVFQGWENIQFHLRWETTFSLYCR